MTLPRTCVSTFPPPEGTVSVEQLELRELIVRANKIMRGRKPCCPVWRLCYDLGHLGSNLRWRRSHEAEQWCVSFFEAQTEQEQQIARDLWWKATCFDGNYWVGTFPERHFEERLAEAKRCMTERHWIDEYLGPVRTPVFIAMCRRKFGRAVARRMTDIHRERLSRAAVKSEAKKAEAKKAAKKRVEQTERELAKFPCFTSEGGIASRN